MSGMMELRPDNVLSTIIVSKDYVRDQAIVVALGNWRKEEKIRYQFGHTLRWNWAVRTKQSGRRICDSQMGINSRITLPGTNNRFSFANLSKIFPIFVTFPVLI